MLQYRPLKRNEKHLKIFLYISSLGGHKTLYSKPLCICNFVTTTEMTNLRFKYRIRCLFVHVCEVKGLSNLILKTIFQILQSR